MLIARMGDGHWVVTTTSEMELAKRGAPIALPKVTNQSPRRFRFLSPPVIRKSDIAQAGLLAHGSFVHMRLPGSQFGASGICI